MSLSRYFQNAPSFQAEDLVKQNDKTSPGWTPDPKKDKRPFQSQPLRPPSVTHYNITTNNTATVQDKSTNPADLSPSSLKENKVQAAEHDIDLSNYVDRAEAEQQIADAYQQGLQEGLAKADQDFGAAARAVLLACQQLDTVRATIIGNSSKELLDFSLAVAERILRFSIKDQDHTIVATIEEALRRAVKSDEFTIHIHPDDYDILARKSSDIVAGLSGLNNIVIRKDTTIERGGARIESDNCTIDATIACQFEMIREELNNKL